MLNTKSIKKKNDVKYDNTDNSFKNENSFRKLETNDTISNKEIIKLHNENIERNNENINTIKHALIDREVNNINEKFNNMNGGSAEKNSSFDEPQNNKFLNNNLPNNNFLNNNLSNNNLSNNNLSNNNLSNNNLLNNNLSNNNLSNNNLQGGFDSLLGNIQTKPQIIVVAPKNILSDKNIDSYANWDEDKNSYNIYENNVICGYFNNNDILKSIITGSNHNKYIKKYFFIISFNKENEVYEFNFIDSVFTDNLELVIKIQNFIFDLINQIDLLENDSEENLLIFNYQFIIYLFQKNNFINIDPIKIAKFYSTITYRYSSLVLKNVMKIENKNMSIATDITKLIEIKKDIYEQINSLENKINKINNNNNDSDKMTNIINISTSDNTNDNSTEEIEQTEETQKIENTKKTEETEKNKEIEEIEETEETEKNKETEETEETEKNKETEEKEILVVNTNQEGSSKNEKTSILDDIISSLSNNNYKNKYLKNNNGFIEINDDVSSYLDKQNSNNIKTSMTSNQQKPSYRITNKYTPTDPSYNKSSAIKNGQIYKIKI